jgi:hypothetical protein
MDELPLKPCDSVSGGFPILEMETCTEQRDLAFQRTAVRGLDVLAVNLQTAMDHGPLRYVSILAELSCQRLLPNLRKIESGPGNSAMNQTNHEFINIQIDMPLSISRQTQGKMKEGKRSNAGFYRKAKRRPSISNHGKGGTSKEQNRGGLLIDMQML